MFYINFRISECIVFYWTFNFTYFREWSKSTFDLFHKLWKNGDAPKAGISLLPITRLTSDSIDTYNGLWRSIPFGFRDFDSKELEILGKKHNRIYKWISFCALPESCSMHFLVFSFKSHFALDLAFITWLLLVSQYISFRIYTSELWMVADTFNKSESIHSMSWINTI